MHKPLAMWIAVELIIMPIMLISAIIVIAIVESFSVAAIGLSLVIFVTLFVSIRGLFRFVSRVEHDEGVEAWVKAPLKFHEVQTRSPGVVETKTDMDSQETEEFDLVDECGDESFPASDPPSWTLGGSDETARHPPGEHS